MPPARVPSPTTACWSNDLLKASSDVRARSELQSDARRKDRRRCDLLAKFGYVIYTVRAHRRGYRDDPYLLDTLGGAGNLLHGFYGALSFLMDKGVPCTDDRYERAFDVLSVDPAGRRVWLKADAGHYGSDGNTTNVDTGRRRGFGSRDASMTAKRAMLVVPPAAQVGFLFCERRSGSHLRDFIEAFPIRACKAHFGVMITVDQFVDVASWNRFLDESEGYEVKSVWRPRTLEQQVGGDNTENEGQLKMTLTGGAAARVGRRMRDAVRQKLSHDGKAGIEISAPPEVTPAEPDAFRRERLEVTLDSENERRTVVIERAELPLFVYPLGERLGDQALRDVWTSEAERLGETHGVDVTGQWHTGKWDEEVLSVKVPVH